MSTEKLHLLTEREKQILTYIAEGNTNIQISELLSIAENTVKTHRKNIKRKLEMVSTADLVKFAQKAGLIAS
jgi:DNA-binding CsgD family transcriptional regulator